MTAARGALLACAAFMLMATAARYLDRPFRFDEADFALMAREGILRHGVPAIPPGEQRSLAAVERAGPSETRYGMWHPPLYMYSLAAAAAILPPTNWSLRLAGLLFLLATLLVAWRLTARLAPELPRITRAIPLAIALLSPLVVEAALFLDIDGTVLCTALLLFLERWLAWRDRLTAPRVAALAALFALSLGAKLTTPFLALAAAAFHALLDERRTRLTAALVVAGAAGTALFGAAYLAYCAAADYPAGYMFDLYGTRRDQIGSGTSAAALALAVRWNLTWISPALVLLIALYAGVRSGALLRGGKPEDADILWIFAAINAVLYVGVAAYWGKYTAPAALAGALGAGIWLARAWTRGRIARPGAMTAVLAALGMLTAAMVSPRVRLGPAVPSLEAALLDPRNLSAFVMLAGAGLIALAARRFIEAPTRALCAGFALACALAVTSVIDQARVVFSAADNGPLRAGTERGFDALVRRLNTLEDAPLILAPKEIGYYYRGRSYPLETAAARGAEAVARLSARPDIRIVIDALERPVIAGPNGVPGADLEQVGTFRVYVKR